MGDCESTKTFAFAGLAHRTGEGEKDLVCSTPWPRHVRWHPRFYWRSPRMRFLHTMVRVTDLEASLHFYCELLGLEVLNRFDIEAGRDGRESAVNLALA